MSVIHPCAEDDSAAAWQIVNAAATAYAGVIPGDRCQVPYMSQEDLCREIDDGVRFWGWYEDERLVGAMGVHDADDVTLIRHAYVQPSREGRGIGEISVVLRLGDDRESAAQRTKREEPQR